MLVKEAKKITGSMTRTKKMPGLSYSMPAWECITGKKLRKVKGSVCAGCYALKGNYTRYPAIKAAQYYRLATLMEPDWVPAMVAQVKRQRWFRWHDAGDIQSAKLGSGGMMQGTSRASSISLIYSKFANKHQAPDTGCQRAKRAF